ncbi:CHAP domain-containing protein [Neokomagataea tanensis]|uniref:CHAP domain-containing protein n=1 Tax=Neokomagataea tanensis TaxID=661191 RepID=A0A4Y6V7B3_9PROT|nr:MULTISPECIES: CHAP domain-containing protein [Neokomagataea]QDH24416.1 CHAP domain-containing protein [Neokomagataea tanensis]
MRLPAGSCLSLWHGLALAALLALTACGGGGRFDGALQCAPYAREKTGVDLRGNAASWWWQANGRYTRTHSPEAGSILVFKATRRMPYGHVSVVRRVVSDDTILVDQANWAPGEIDRSVPVKDISHAHDWSLVRVWWSPSGVMGLRSNPTYGFIIP